MSLPWVKLHVPLLNNRDFKHLSPGAKLTFVTTLMLAGDLDKGDYSGRLESASGPVSLDELATHTGMKARLQADAITELLEIGFLSQDLAGTIVVERFEEKAGNESFRESNRERQRRFRNAHRNATSNVTDNAPNVTDKEVEEEVEEDNCASALRLRAIGYATWPEDVPTLQGLALIFVARFANCHDLEKAAKHLGPYTSLLAEIRERCTIAVAWKACEDALVANGKPLFGASIKMAKSFMPGSIGRRHERAGSSSQIRAISEADL